MLYPSKPSHMAAALAMALVISSVSAAEGAPRKFKDRGITEIEVLGGDLTAQSVEPRGWVRAKAGGYGNVEVGHEVLLELAPGEDFETAMHGTKLRLKEKVSDTVYLLEGANVSDALDESEALSAKRGILTARPVFRRQPSALAAYAPAPTDTLFSSQWHLDNRDAEGNQAGADLNVRGAWPITKGQGAILAVVDDGVDLTHPDLSGRATSMPHFNFLTGLASGLPSTSSSSHGTAVAGLALATADNSIGVSGVAPQSQLASWIVLGQFGLTEDALRKMYEHRLDIIDVQNHSWGWITLQQVKLSALEETGIARAFTLGRGGRGVVNVRAGGNDRGVGQNVNDEQAASDPRVIAVAAVRKDGRVTSYSEPGACVLVAAPSGDTTQDFINLVTTDRRGSAGYNTSLDAADSPDYTVGADGFSGTSASSPEIAGVAALMISANSRLTVRDVQQILALSARHFDLNDPRLQTNGAGLLVSDNVGYGVPDAGEAVRLAKLWTPKPAATNFTFSSSAVKLIPELAGVEFRATNLAPAFIYVPSMPSLGFEPRDPTELLPLVYVGRANSAITQNLQGKGALIERGDSFFWEKINRAADAGAAFAIVYDNSGTTNTMIMGATDFVTIPAAFINKRDGDYIRQTLQGGTNVSARISSGSEDRAATYAFTVNQTLVTEHVSVRVQTDHPRRSDVRIVVVSPSGTESVMQRRTLDDSPGPSDYTFYSVQHFFEPSAGEWKVHIYDEEEGRSGSARLVELNIRGVSITDRDRDGLDDGWEMQHFGNLTFNLLGDEDNDGYNNAREHAMRTSPVAPNAQFRMDWAAFSPGRSRISWPSAPGKEYRVLTADNKGQVTVFKTIRARSNETELVVPINAGVKLFRIEERN